MNLRHATPWYRSKWPWLLMLAPAFALFGGIAMLVVAFASNDGLVAEDYYKQGLTINQQLQRERRASALDLSAQLQFSPGRALLQLSVPGPTVLRVRFVHPTRAANDHEVPANRTGPFVYEAALPVLEPGKWLVQIEDLDRTWRMTGEWNGESRLRVLARTTETAP